MKFSTKEDLEIPIWDVFDSLSDFDAFEKAALRRGADVTRVNEGGDTPVGMSWQIRAQLRGKMRDLVVTLAEHDGPNQISYDVTSGGVKALFLIELVALSRKRTRMRMELDLRPKTLPARLLMQSAKLARNTLNKRYKTRIAHFAEDLEDRHKRAQKPSLG